MSKENVINLFKACGKNPNLLEKFNQKNLPEVLLHAKSLGYNFTSDELTALLGSMETYIITNRMGEEINAYSSLWPKMWGKYRFQYVLEELINTFSEQEIEQFLTEDTQ